MLLAAWHSIRIPLAAALLLLFIGIRFGRRRSTQSHSHELPQPAQDSKSGGPTIAVHEAIPRDSIKNSVKAGRRASPRRIRGQKPARRTNPGFSPAKPDVVQPVVFYASLSGHTEKQAAAFVESLSGSFKSQNLDGGSKILSPELRDLSYIEYDDYFTSLPKLQETQPHAPAQNIGYFYLLLVPSYNIDTILTNFLEHLKETHHDFRVDTAPLSNILGYAVFGFGDKQGWPSEAEGFCSQAQEVDMWLSRLTGKKRAYPLGLGDVTSDATHRLTEWREGVEAVLRDLAAGKTLGEGVPGSGDAVESDNEDEQADEVLFGTNTADASRRKPQTKQDTVADLENLQGSEPAMTGPVPTDFTTSTNTSRSASNPAPKEMVPATSPTYAALTKQGYTIVGSHSGVKICRWTKSALRGRGSCYKFSFYGIKSHLCMETTPSLSCSNKCVFCWRHGTNPVGTTWRWQVDPPELIFSGVKEGHYKKIKMLRGVPGVRAERFEEAMRIRHCALSLVGEPIFYPHINEFVALLHNERISSFLVCNAQHPAQLAALRKVTQLYVSIDAADRDSLRRIDRPLHRDFWERFLACMHVLRAKRAVQRTVFRLTLVKGFNLADAAGYADLVARALPCFVEVKGVTYCGTSASSGAGLTMQNVPFYDEVCRFVEALDAELAARGLAYGIAAEHAHSCCVLIASKRFLSPEGRWCTVIDYGRFFELLEAGEEFAPEDYVRETPEWALWGNGGFDPADERVYRKGAKGAKKSAAVDESNVVVEESKAVVEI